MRILLVGPYCDDLALIGWAARQRGWSALHLEPAALARWSPGEDPPSLVVVDCRAGNAALAPFAQPGFRIVIAVVADGSLATLRAAVEAGAHDVLVSPVLPDVLEHRLVPIERGSREMLAARGRQERHLVEYRRLREDALRFELVAKATNDAVYDWSIPDGVIHWNSAMSTLYGAPVEDGVAGLDWWTEQIHPEDRDRIAKGLDAAIAARRASWSDEYRFRRADGSYADVLDRGHVMFDPEGHPLRMIGVMMDITTRREVQGRLVLADRMAQVGTLAAGVAHEVNNPLTWLMARLEVAQEAVAALPGGPMREELRAALADAREGSRRIRDIIRDLRVFARAEDEALAAVDVQRVLESAVAVAMRELSARARLVRDYRPVPPILGNEARLGQVFLNLLVNAVQATPEGDPDGHSITVGSEVDAEGRVAVWVADTGSGVPRELHARIFDLFFTTKPAGEGTGLGLSVSRQLVEQMGGRIELQSEPGRGSRFTVRLPVAALEPTLPAPPPAAASVSSRRARLLIVDDEPMIVSFVQDVLARDHDVVGHTSAEAALTWLAEGHPVDLVLCDLMMPELDGEGFFDRLGALRPEVCGAVTFITGGAYAPKALRFLERSGRPRLDKPFEIRALRELARAAAG